MFNGGTTPGSTSLFGQTTPVNQNRTASGFLFNSTANQPSTLTSTPFASPNLFGKTKKNERMLVLFVIFYLNL